MWTYGKPVLSLCLIGVLGVLLVSAVFLICDWNVASMFFDFEVFVVFFLQLKLFYILYSELPGSVAKSIYF